MTNDEFLSYCLSMTDTERCGFTPQNAARLLRLAGDEPNAAYWDKQPNQVISNCHDHVRLLVENARAIRETEETPK